MTPRIEFINPDGVQVLEGRDAIMHVVLEWIVDTKRKLIEDRSLGLSDHCCRLKLDTLLRKISPIGRVAEPYRSQIIEAVGSLVDMLGSRDSPLVFTPAEQPIARAYEANDEAEVKLTASMTESERELDSLKQVVKQLRQLPSTLEREYALEMLSRIRDDIDRARELGIPGMEPLIAEMKMIHDRIERQTK